MDPSDSRFDPSESQIAISFFEIATPPNLKTIPPNLVSTPPILKTTPSVSKRPLCHATGEPPEMVRTDAEECFFIEFVTFEKLLRLNYSPAPSTRG